MITLEKIRLIRGEVKSSAGSLALVEPLAHAPGHYSHFLQKMNGIFESSGYETDVIIGPPASNTSLNCSIESSVSNFTYTVIYKISHLGFLKKFKRIIYIDLISTLALRNAASSHKKIIFFSTFYILPYVYYLLFVRKSCRVIFYRFNHHYFKNKIVKFFANKIFKNCARNIYFQSEFVLNEFRQKTGGVGNYLPIPIVPIPPRVDEFPEELFSDFPPKGEMIEILIFGINHISKDLHTLLNSLSKLEDKVKHKVRLVVAGAQIEHGGRVTGDMFRAVHVETLVVNRRITLEEKLYLFRRADYCFAGFKKSFTSSSGTLVDCIELQLPFIATFQQEITQLFQHEVWCKTYEAENSVSLRNVMETLVNDHKSSSTVVEMRVPDSMTKERFLLNLNLHDLC